MLCLHRVGRNWSRVGQSSYVDSRTSVIREQGECYITSGSGADKVVLSSRPFNLYMDGIVRDVKECIGSRLTVDRSNLGRVEITVKTVVACRGYGTRGRLDLWGIAFEFGRVCEEEAAS